MSFFVTFSKLTPPASDANATSSTTTRPGNDFALGNRRGVP